ncbi:GNAT family N-acetyltransferase [Methylophaga nitratireducenticrescens]|nr:GNAT family N-acetyltransferase [Methylophaga nitratireducenticrescens]
MIRKIQTEDPTRISSGSSCFQPLSSFLKRDAKNCQNSHIATTYVIGRTDPGKDTIISVLGYITITNSEIDVQDTYALDDCPHADRYDSLPAVKIARLLVSTDYRKYGLGRNLLNFVLALVMDEIVPRVGCRFIIVDAKEEAISFYEKMGFSFLDTDTNRGKKEPIMFLDLYKYNGNS